MCAGAFVGGFFLTLGLAFLAALWLAVRNERVQNHSAARDAGRGQARTFDAIIDDWERESEAYLAELDATLSRQE